MCKYYIILTYLIICLLISFIMYFKFKNCNIIEFYEGNRFSAGGCKTCEDGKIVNQDKTGCEACPDGQKPNSDGTGCESCPIGTAGTNGTCEPCKKDITYQDETGQTRCKECSKCEANNYVSTECSLSSNTVCSRCNKKIVRDYGEAKLELNTYGPPHNICNGNCKVEFTDNLLEGNDVDIAGRNENGTVTFTHYVGENKITHYPNAPVKIGGLTKENKFYYFWQHAPGNTRWKFYIMTDPRKYNPANNYLKTCMECSKDKRPNINGSGECLDYYAQPWRLKNDDEW